MWTGGKDCSLALHEVRRSGLDVRELVTFAPPEPVFLAHPLPFLKRQAAAMGLPHRTFEITSPAAEGYGRALRELKEEGIEALVTGDIAEVEGHPNWVREVGREVGLGVHTPLWGRARRALLRDLLGAGFKTVFSLVKKPWFDRSWVGRGLDERAVSELEGMAAGTSMDLCGENGEYHTLVLDGPTFKTGLRIAAFDVREKEGMLYMDIRGLAAQRQADRAGLCGACVHARALVTKGGGGITLCEAAASDKRLSKYPSLPKLSCPAYVPKGGAG